MSEIRVESVGEDRVRIYVSGEQEGNWERHAIQRAAAHARKLSAANGTRAARITTGRTLAAGWNGTPDTYEYRALYSVGVSSPVLSKEGNSFQTLSTGKRVEVESVKPWELNAGDRVTYEGIQDGYVTILARGACRYVTSAYSGKTDRVTPLLAWWEDYGHPSVWDIRNGEFHRIVRDL